MYNITAFNYFYLSFFYLKQSLNEVITAGYYLVGCFIYQIISQLNALFLNKQQKLNSNSFYTKNTFLHADKKLNNLSVLTPPSGHINTNLFFLQKTLTPTSVLSESSLSLLQTTTSTSEISLPLINLNTNFLHKVHFLSTTPVRNQLGTNKYDIFTENNYALSTQLNPHFNSNLTFSTNLNELNLNSNLFAHDPMLGEVLTTGHNNIAKQQR